MEITEDIFHVILSSFYDLTFNEINVLSRLEMLWNVDRITLTFDSLAVSYGKVQCLKSDEQDSFYLAVRLCMDIYHWTLAVL